MFFLEWRTISMLSSDEVYQDLAGDWLVKKVVYHDGVSTSVNPEMFTVI